MTETIHATALIDAGAPARRKHRRRLKEAERGQVEGERPSPARAMRKDKRKRPARIRNRNLIACDMTNAQAAVLDAYVEALAMGTRAGAARHLILQGLARHTARYIEVQADITLSGRLRLIWMVLCGSAPSVLQREIRRMARGARPPAGAGPPGG